jgi:putative two-component system response regulator
MSELILMDISKPNAHQHVVMVVDDNPDNLNVVADLLSTHYSIRAVPSGYRALELLEQNSLPDLILLDVMMPGMDGYQVLKRIKDMPAARDIPIIFLTALDSTRDEEMGLDAGAVDYITKPIRPSILMARVKTHLELKEARDRLDAHNDDLEGEVARRMAENEQIKNVGIRALARLAETRDKETGRHILRTSLYVRTLAKILQKMPMFQLELTDKAIELIANSTPLHDIGKVGIPDHILQKPGKLTEEEWVIMKTHAELGARAIEMAEKDSETSLSFFQVGKDIAHWHHEKWDGSGYPDGLKWNEIPLSAKLMAIADVFDALVSARVYKEAFGFDKAKEIMTAGRGNHFDPVLLDEFLKHYDEFVAIATRYRETSAPESTGG